MHVCVCAWSGLPFWIKEILLFQQTHGFQLHRWTLIWMCVLIQISLHISAHFCAFRHDPQNYKIESYFLWLIIILFVIHILWMSSCECLQRYTEKITNIYFCVFAVIGLFTKGSSKFRDSLLKGSTVCICHLNTTDDIEKNRAAFHFTFNYLASLLQSGKKSVANFSAGFVLMGFLEDTN